MNIPTVIRAAVKHVPQVIPYLSPEALKAAGDLSSANAAYHDAITKALLDYFDGGSVMGPRNAWTKAMVEAFGVAFDTGWIDGGGEGQPDTDALAWFNARVEQEQGFIGSVFEQAKELKQNPEADTFAWATARADGFTGTVLAIYNAAVMLAMKNGMLTWHLGATEKHCQTCAKLDGQSHRASWFRSRNYIPREAGAGMDCGGYNCDCSLTDADGNEVTL